MTREARAPSRLCHPGSPPISARVSITSTRSNGLGTHLASSICDHGTLVGVIELLNRIDVFDIAFCPSQAKGHAAMLFSPAPSDPKAHDVNLLLVCESAPENLHLRARRCIGLRPGLIYAHHWARRVVELVMIKLGREEGTVERELNLGRERREFEGGHRGRLS